MAPLSQNKDSFEGNAPPPDFANLAYIIYFALGTGVLFPWNSFITAVDYFQFLYPDQHIDRVFSVAYLFPCLAMLFLLTLFGQNISTTLRVNFSFVLFLACLILVPVLDALCIKDDSLGSRETFYGTVAFLVVSGVANAIMQGSLVGSAGALPERYMQAFVAGTSASGVIISLLRITTKFLLPQTPSGLRASGNIYFGVAAGFQFVCLVAFNLLNSLPVINHYRMAELRSTMKSGGSSEETEPLRVSTGLEADDFEGKVNRTGVNLPLSLGLTVSSSASGPKTGVKSWMNANFTHVLKQIKWLAATLVLTYIITLSIYPGFLAEDVHSEFLGDWYALLLLTSYNVFDLVGKELTPLYVPESTAVMIGGSCGRLLFFPLFFACLHGPHVFRTEVPVFLLTSLLGLTNGYLSSCLFVVSPKRVPLAEAETAGIVMIIALFGGLSIGSLVSWVWTV